MKKALEQEWGGREGLARNSDNLAPEPVLCFRLARQLPKGHSPLSVTSLGSVGVFCNVPTHPGPWWGERGMAVPWGKRWIIWCLSGTWGAGVGMLVY